MCVRGENGRASSAVMVSETESLGIVVSVTVQSWWVDGEQCSDGGGVHAVQSREVSGRHVKEATLLLSRA